MTKILRSLKNSSVVMNYQRMWPFIKPYKWRALGAILITIPVGMMDAAIAWSLKPFFDGIMAANPPPYVLYLPFIVILFGVMQGGFNYAATYLNTWIGRKISNDVKLVLFEKLMRNDPAFFDKETSGQIQFRFNHDVDTACNGLITNVKVFVTRIVSSIALIAVLLYNSWLLAVVAVAVLFGALFPLTKIRRKIEKIMDKTVFSGALVSTHYNETFSGNRIITSYNLAPYQKKRFGETLHSLFNLGMAMTKRTAIVSPMMHIIISIGIALVIWLGSYLIVTQEITAGNFVSFLTALLMLYTPIKGIGNNFNAVLMSFMAMERVWTLLDQTPSILNKADAKTLDHIKTSIEYRNVSFAYEADKPVLKNINLFVKIGQTIAVVGNSGGGKSSFASLLPRFYDVSEGAILIDGTDIRDLDLDQLRQKIAVVFQDNFLFAGTIRDNIVLGQTNVSDAQINQALKDACLEDFIHTLDKGLDTEIGERGIMLSGGQRQRVGIARAFLKNAPIVILDEATSALDNKSETVVQEAITNLMKDRTVFIIAHRLSTIRHADKIVVLNHGEIVEEGRHDELIQKQGAYAALYNTK